MTMNWTVIAGISNPMDKIVGYQGLLAAMRAFVSVGGNVPNGTIQINQTAGNEPPRTTLQMTNNNFTVVQVNSNVINYNYSDPAPTFATAGIAAAFPVGNVNPTQDQKTRLLYLLVEAARSKVIEDAFVTAITTGAVVNLSTYSPLVKAYAHTCNLVHITVAHPERPLAAADYCAYAATLPEGTPDKEAINSLCGCP